MSMDTNNIKLTYKGMEVSIAQHRTYEAGTSKVTTDVQEVAIIPQGMGDEYVIRRFHSGVNDLIDVLYLIKLIIDDQSWYEMEMSE